MCGTGQRERRCDTTHCGMEWTGGKRRMCGKYAVHTIEVRCGSIHQPSISYIDPRIQPHQQQVHTRRHLHSLHKQPDCPATPLSDDVFFDSACCSVFCRNPCLHCWSQPPSSSESASEALGRSATPRSLACPPWRRLPQLLPSSLPTRTRHIRHCYSSNRSRQQSMCPSGQSSPA